jgi:hypothetical protein
MIAWFHATEDHSVKQNEDLLSFDPVTGLTTCVLPTSGVASFFLELGARHYTILP